MKRSTLVAGAVLLVLAGYVYFFEREPAPTDEGEKVFAVEREALSRIDIAARDKDRVTIEKTPAGWRILAPRDGDGDGEGAGATEAAAALAADPKEVELLVDNLANMAFERRVAKAAEVELENFGLEDPVVSVTFSTEGGSSQGIRFGSDTPTSGNRYAWREGDADILVLASYLSLNFEKTAWDLRDKTVFHSPEEAEWERIEIARPEGPLVFVRDAGEIRLQSPFRARAEAYDVDQLAQAIASVEMQELVTDASFDADVPTVTTQLFVAGTGPLVLEVGDKKDFDYFARSPSRDERFLVDGSLVDDLTADATLYVAKKLFELSPRDVVALVINERTIEKSDSRWLETLPESESRDIETELVESLLEKLEGLRADAATKDAPFEAASRLALVGGEPRREEGIELGEGADGSVLVRRDGEEVFLTLAGESWAEIESLLPLRIREE